MSFRAFIILLLVCPTGLASAETITSLGVGTHSCGAWLTARRQPGAASNAYEAWIAGYLTGFNYFNKFEVRDFTHDTDIEGVFAAIDNYCREKPLELIDDALLSVTIELAEHEIGKGSQKILNDVLKQMQK